MAKAKALKKMPDFASDDEADAWLQSADLTEYEDAGAPFKAWLADFEALHKDARVYLRPPRALIEGYKAAAKKGGIPYQRLMRTALSKALDEAAAPPKRRAVATRKAGASRSAA